MIAENSVIVMDDYSFLDISNLKVGDKAYGGVEIKEINKNWFRGEAYKLKIGRNRALTCLPFNKYDFETVFSLPAQFKSLDVAESVVFSYFVFCSFGDIEVSKINEKISYEDEDMIKDFVDNCFSGDFYLAKSFLEMEFDKRFPPTPFMWSRSKKKLFVDYFVNFHKQNKKIGLAKHIALSIYETSKSISFPVSIFDASNLHHGDGVPLGKDNNSYLLLDWVCNDDILEFVYEGLCYEVKTENFGIFVDGFLVKTGENNGYS